MWDTVKGWGSDFSDWITKNDGGAKMEYAGSAITAVAGMYTDYQAVRSQQEVAAIQKRIDEMNYKRTVMQANQALAQSNNQIAQITQKYGQIKSKQNVAAAANGIAIGYGSHRDIQVSTELTKQMDVHSAYTNGLYAALGYMNKATAIRMASSARQASVARTGAVMGDSLLTAANQIGTATEKYNKRTSDSSPTGTATKNGEG